MEHWLLVTFLVALCLSVSELRAEPYAVGLNSITEMQTKLNELDEQIRTRKIFIRSAQIKWEELESFHEYLNDSIVNDPYYGENDPLVSEQALARTEKLKLDLNKLFQLRHVAEDAKVAGLFDEYVHIVTQVVSLRQARRYSSARTLLKRQVSSGLYEKILEGLATHYAKEMQISVNMSPKDQATLLYGIGELTGQVRTLAGRLEGDEGSLFEGQRLRNELAIHQERYEKHLTMIHWLLVLMAPIFGLTVFVAGFMFARRKKATTSHYVLAKKQEESPSDPKIAA